MDEQIVAGALHQGILEARVKELEEVQRFITMHPGVFDSRIFLGRVNPTSVYAREGLDASVVDIINGVINQEWPQPERKPPYDIEEDPMAVDADDLRIRTAELGITSEDIKRLGVEGLLRISEEYDREIARDPKVDIYYVHLGVLLGKKNVSRHREDGHSGGMFRSNSSSDDIKDLELYFIPENGKVMGFLMHKHSDNMGLMGLGHHFKKCLKIEVIKPNYVIQTVDFPVLTKLMDKYIGLPDATKASVDFGRFSQGTSDYDTE